MSVRRAIIDANTRGLNVAEFCRQHGISRWFFYDLRRRHAVEGDMVLEPKSRAPHHPAGRTPAVVEEAIVAKRKDLDNAGWDCGPASIAAHLHGLAGLPSEATIWRLLTARGLITPQPSKKPRSGRSWTAERVNECWALDDWEHTLADGTKVRILETIDDHSRYAVTCAALLHCTGAAAFHALAAAAPYVGWPARFWSDNAKAFTETLAAALTPLGVVPSHTRPGSPHSNGKAERFHQTTQKWLAKQPPASTLDELQGQLDRFRLFYNTQRPHRSLARRFPADVWHDAPKTGPSNQPVNTPTHVHDAVVHNGRLNAGRARRITIGAAYNGQRALTVITANNCHVFVNGHLVRQLTIDPTRHSQPLHPRPGKPPPTL